MIRAVHLVCILILLTPLMFGQDYVSRYDLFTGYTNLNSPVIGLVEHGFHTQVGMRPRTWYSIGFDYSIGAGDLSLTPDLLPTALQQQLGKQLALLAAAGKLPPGYALIVPARSVSQTFALGPQLAFRHWSKVTLFVRPSLGAIREVATPKPKDAIAAGIVAGLAPSGKKTDWQGFYGAGGGFDLNFSKHVSLRTQVDVVWDHLFDDILRSGRTTVRFSIGPAFNFGRNIKE